MARDERGAVRLYDSATLRRTLIGDIDAMSLWAGQGVGQLHSVENAGAVVARMVEEADNVVRRLAAQMDRLRQPQHGACLKSNPRSMRRSTLNGCGHHLWCGRVFPVPNHLAGPVHYAHRRVNKRPITRAGPC